MAGTRLIARLLGAPAFSWRGALVEPRATKAVALLMYLARADSGVERRDLAELLWGPGRSGSVHQALHTLRAAPGGEHWLSAGRGPVRLHGRCDVTVFERLVRRGRPGTALALWRGTPFDGVEVPGAPAFEDWLGLERMRLLDLRRQALRAESRRLAACGDSAEAISLAATLLRLDPLDETAHQAVLRLHLQRGDVGAARLQFEACRELLGRELGVDPLPETTELGDAIAAAERAIRDHTPLAAIATTPPALLRPRLLVGRTAQLEALGRAWSRNLIVVLVDVAGAGKSRLALDAAEGRGRYLVLEGRPGDAGVPYASLARAVETVLGAADDAELPRWARSELARVAAAPVAGDGGADAGPIVSSRLGPAVAAALRALEPWVATVVIDGLHAFDEDSRRVVLTAVGEDGVHRPALAITAREEAIAAADARELDAHIAAGTAVAIGLPPLDADAIVALLGAVGIDDGQALAADLERFTGGNPLFVVEVLKDLHAAGQLRSGGGLPAGFEPPDRVVRTLERRLDDLDREALRALRVLALAPGAAVDLVAEVLDRDVHRAAEALGVAEGAGLLADGAFTHALTQEVVAAHVPWSVRRLLHRRLAEALAERIGQPLARAIAEPAHSVAARYAGDVDGAAEHAERSVRRAARHAIAEEQGPALVMQARALAQRSSATAVTVDLDEV